MADSERRITADHIRAAAEHLHRHYDRVYDQYITHYRQTGDGNLERAAQAFGLDSYKEIVDGIEQNRRRREQRIRTQITQRGVSRCYIGFGCVREPDPQSGWWLTYTTLIDLDRYGVRFTLRGRGLTETDADQAAVAQLDRFDLQRPDGEQVAGAYFYSEHDIPRDWAAHRQWAVLRFMASQYDHDALREIWNHPAAAGLTGRPRPGRQQSGYEVLDLGTGPLGRDIDRLTEQALRLLGNPPPGQWDRYLLSYGPGSCIPAHVDPPLRADMVHVRLNVAVQQPSHGGQLILAGEPVALRAGDAVIFRPDVLEHRVTEILGGRRVVFSVGANLPRND